MPATPRFTFAAFLGGFILRLTFWLVCSAAVSYAITRYEHAGRGTSDVKASANANLRATLSQVDATDEPGVSGALAGVVAPQSQQRYTVRPIVPFRSGFRGFIYESLDDSPVTNEPVMASILTAGPDGSVVQARLVGYMRPTGVDLTTAPSRLGNYEPPPHPAGGWFLVCGLACLMLLPWPAARQGLLD